MRFLVLAGSILTACSQPDPSPVTVGLKGGLLTVHNASTAALIISEYQVQDGSGEDGEIDWPFVGVGLEVFDPELGAWRWYGEDCRHRMTDWTTQLDPGTTAANSHMPEPDSAGRFRYVVAFRRAGEEWQWMPVGEFENLRTGGREPTWEHGGYGKWPASSPVTLRVSNVRPNLESKNRRFLMDLEIENGSDQPISYNVTTNYWWCEEAGRWYRHPGWTICGNSAHPEIGIGQTKRITSAGKEWGRLRYGMGFDGLDDHFQARSEPFEVPYEWSATGGAPTSD